MQTIKKRHLLAIIIVLAVLCFAFIISTGRRSYSLADFGVTPLMKGDCSLVRDATANAPISVSFNVRSVSDTRNKIKLLVTKYGGKISSDSFSSYPSYPSVNSAPSNSDTGNITATFDKSRDEFLAELADLVKSSGGVDTSYNYIDGSMIPQYGSSSYSSCISLMQNVTADALQLQVFTNAIKKEHDPGNIALLSQNISTAKATLQSDINSVNSFLSSYEKPSVTISLNNIQ